MLGLGEMFVPPTDIFKDDTQPTRPVPYSEGRTSTPGRNFKLNAIPTHKGKVSQNNCTKFQRLYDMHLFIYYIILYYIYGHVLPGYATLLEFFDNEI